MIKIEYKAGKMNYNKETKKVNADPRAGKIVIERDDQNQKTFKWIDEATKKEEIILIVFRNDAKFSKVKKTNGGRIYLLSFLSFDDKYFFWLQEPDYTKDSEFVEKVNRVINLQEDEPLDKEDPQEQ